MDSAKLKRATERLMAEREKRLTAIENIQENGLNQQLSDSSGELSAYDNHPADLGSEVFERSKDIALRDNEQILISNIDHALTKIKTGSYGICDICGDVIPDARLDILPWAATCMKCQQKQDSHPATRPVEKYSLQIPFGRTFLDHDVADSIGFDAEDSLQAVWHYGSSDSPQDLPGSHDFSDSTVDSEEQGIVEQTDKLAAHIDGSYDRSASLNRDTAKRKW